MMRCSVFAALLAAACAAPCGPGTSTLSVVEAQGDMRGKLVVITGGDSGIGYQTALALSQGNASVVILSYDAAGKGKAAAENITKLSGNPVEVQQCDLSSFASVRAGAAGVLAKHKKVDVLICDAGIDKSPSSLSPVTDDGFERVMQVNYIGHFLLVDLLLPALRASGAGRVVVLSSLSASNPCGAVVLPYGRGCTDLSKMEELARAPPKGLDATNYGVSKFAMVYFAKELAAREKGPVSFYSARPGFVEGTGLTKVPKAEQELVCLAKFHFKPCPIPTANGGATPAYLASAPSIPATASGEEFFFCESVTPPDGTEMHGYAWNATVQSAFFEVSKNWTGA